MAINLKMLAAVAVAAGALALGGASSAQALNVGTLGTPVGAGTMTVTADAGASRLVINGSVPLNCTDTRAEVTIDTGVFSTPATISVARPIFEDCVGPSGFTYTYDCAESASLNVTGGGPNTWDGYLDSISCVYTFDALGCSATISGEFEMSYTNPIASPATDAVLTVFAAGQTVTISGSTCPSQLLPNGTGEFGAPGTNPTDVDDLDYVLTDDLADQPLLS